MDVVSEDIHLSLAGALLTSLRQPAEAGDRVGRFELIELLGRGGMGQVFRAHDPQLDREVAIKLLNHAADARSQARMLREAQALAKLNHPNILPIYDIGVVHEEDDSDEPQGIYLAMQLVEGQNLRQWLRAGPRSQRDILECFIAAGRGLQAAHEAGLVHRDFKPANVMVGDDGRTVVMDFGLARNLGELTRGSSEAWRAHTAFDESVTETGTVVGTPAYMAPEQHRAGPVDTSIDQFAFCLSLWEALTGARPFSESSTLDQLDAKQNARFIVSAREALPRWLRGPLQRGLKPNPERRFATMAPILEVLERGLGRRDRHRRVAGAMGLVAVASVAAWAALPDSDRVPCDAARDRIAEVWNADARSRVESALEGAGRSYAAQTWQRLEPILDEYAEQWVETHAEVCDGMRREPGGGYADASMRCLHGRVEHLRALVGALSEADPQVAIKAVDVTMSLPPVARCTDVAHLGAQVTPPDEPMVREGLMKLESQLAQVRVLYKTGKYEAGLELAQTATTEAETLGHGPAWARAAQWVGYLSESLGDYPRASEWLERAYFEAERWGQLDVQSTTAQQLVFLEARLHHFDDARRWTRHAEVAIEQLGDESRRAGLISSKGQIYMLEDRLDEALGAQYEALAIQQRILDPQDLALARIHTRIAHIQLSAGRVDSALESYHRALAIEEQALGTHHPQTAGVHNDIGNAYQALGRYDEALRSMQHTLSVYEDSFRPDHPEIAVVLSNIGMVHASRQDYDEALPFFERALAIQQRADAPMRVGLLNNIASCHHQRHDNRAALRDYRRALSLLEQEEGVSPTTMATLLGNIGNVHVDLGELDSARDSYQRSLELHTQHLGTEHPDLIYPLMGLGELLVRQKDFPAALQALERSATIIERAEVGTDMSAAVHFALAKALMTSGEDPLRARRLARLAQEEFESVSGDFDEHLADIEQWFRQIDSRGGGSSR